MHVTNNLQFSALGVAGGFGKRLSVGSRRPSLRAPIERFATLTWRTRRGGTELSETTPISLPLTDRAASARVMDSPSLSEGSFIIVDRDSEQSQSLPGPFPPKDTHPDASVVHYFHRS